MQSPRPAAMVTRWLPNFAQVRPAVATPMTAPAALSDRLAPDLHRQGSQRPQHSPIQAPPIRHGEPSIGRAMRSLSTHVSAWLLRVKSGERVDA